jgi:hypothetical protein
MEATEEIKQISAPPASSAKRITDNVPLTLVAFSALYLQLVNLYFFVLFCFVAFVFVAFFKIIIP